jgi:acetyl esterase/lipase
MIVVPPLRWAGTTKDLSSAVVTPRQCGTTIWESAPIGVATSAYAAPGRAQDLSDLPPAFIQVNGLDPLRDEGIHYALALMAAGVPVELYCAPHQHHGLSEDPRTAAAAVRLYKDGISAELCLPA